MKYILTLILSIAIYHTSFAQAPLSLKECLEIGLEQNYDIRIVRNNEQIADNNYTLGNAGYLPTIDLSAGYSGTVNNTEQKAAADGETSKNNGVHNQTLNAGLNVNWTAFDGFNIQATYDRLRELQQMGELNTRLTIENFIAQLSAEYYNLIQQIIRLENLKYAVRLSKERVRIVEARYQIGAGSRMELQQAKVDFNSDSSKLVKQYEVLFTSRTSLNEMMAVQDVEQHIHVADTSIQNNAFLIRDDLWNKTLERNPYLLVSQKQRSISEIDLRIAQSQNYPYVRLNAGYGYTRNMYGAGNYDHQQNWGLNYGITVGFNLFDGFNKSRRQKNARIEIQNRELEFEQLQLSVKTEFVNMWMAYQNNLDLLNLERENVQTAHDNYEIAMERYKLGDLAGIELREAQNSLLEAEERLVQAEYSTKICEISLIQISGQALTYLD